jgi:pyruvate/2-oxoglutarate dehydrogenase complex dihydrolipoamide acyltransferase (E2) component
MANGMMGNSMGAQPPVNDPASMTQTAEDAILDMHLTEDVKKALQAKGVDISAVMNRGPQEPVVVIPISAIMDRYPSESPEESMKQFVMDMTQSQQQVSAPSPMANQPQMAADAPKPEGLGAPMNRPPMTA